MRTESEAPRIWKMRIKGWDDPVVLEGPRVDDEDVEVVEKAPVDAERERMLDLLERARGVLCRLEVRIDAEHSGRSPLRVEIETLLVEHGRLPEGGSNKNIRPDGNGEALGVLVSMASDDELAALEATFEDEGCQLALAALRTARQRVQAEVEAFRPGEASNEA